MKECYVYVNDASGLPFVSLKRRPELKLVGIAASTKEARELMADYLKDRKS